MCADILVHLRDMMVMELLSEPCSLWTWIIISCLQYSGPLVITIINFDGCKLWADPEWYNVLVIFLISFLIILYTSLAFFWLPPSTVLMFLWNSLSWFYGHGSAQFLIDEAGIVSPCLLHFTLICSQFHHPFYCLITSHNILHNLLCP